VNSPLRPWRLAVIRSEAFCPGWIVSELIVASEHEHDDASFRSRIGDFV
jgi:hypothetical protein